MYNSKYKKYNSAARIKFAAESYAENRARYEDESDDIASTGDLPSRLGVIPHAQVGGRGDNMWTSTMQSWATGNYPKLADRTSSYAGFADQLSQLNSTRPTAENPVVFSRIKNHATGRHFDVHMFYEPSADGSMRLKAQTVLNHTHDEDPDTGTHTPIDAHGGTHVFDVASGKWHKKGEMGVDEFESYNPYELVRQAPADYIDTTSGWHSPPPSLATCRTCWTQPDNLSAQLDLFRPTRCTCCGEVGRMPEWAAEPSSFVETTFNREKGTRPNAQTSAFRQAQAGVCDNNKCVNYKKNIASSPAFVDQDANVYYPGNEGANGKTRYTLTDDQKSRLIGRRDQMVNVERPRLIKIQQEAALLGDLTDNADYQSVRNERSQLETRINLIASVLENHTIDNNSPMLKLPDEEREFAERSLSFPRAFETDNEEFAARIEGKDITPIKLPIGTITCDNPECPDHRRSIATHVDLYPRHNLPCAHCGRSDGDIVDIVDETGQVVPHRIEVKVGENGYSRCDPLRYGADTCAPVPHYVTNKDLYFESFKPDPIYKLPIVSKDRASGATVIYQPTASGRRRDSAEGLYPGTQSTVIKRPSTAYDPKNGFEDPRGKFIYGRFSPWRYLSMAGRKVAGRPLPDAKFTNYPGDPELSYSDRDPRYDPNLPDNEIRYDANVLDNLKSESITPEVWEDLTDTPFLGPDWLTSSLSQPGATGGSGVDTSAPSSIHPSLLQSEWEEYTSDAGRRASIPSVSEIMRNASEMFKRKRKKFPVVYREPKTTKKESSIKKIATGDRWEDAFSDVNLDLDALAYEHPRLFMPDLVTEETERDLDMKNAQRADKEKYLCPVCHGDSTANDLANGKARYVDSHCEGHDPETCRSGSRNAYPHCSSCGDSDCRGRRRLFWRSKDAVCPGCLNTGEITAFKSHCTHCDSNNCSGPTEIGSIHCPGCPEHAKEQNGEEHDTTPGVHARLFADQGLGGFADRDDFIHDLSKGEQTGSTPEAVTVTVTGGEDDNPVLGTPTATLEHLGDILRHEASEYFATEGYNTEGRSQAEIDAAIRQLATQRADSVEQGLAFGTTPTEDLASTIKQVGPVAAQELASRGNIDIDPKTKEALGEDVERMAVEHSRYSPIQSAQFDSRSALERVEQLRRNTGDALDDISDDSRDPGSYPTGPVIVHDPKCPECIDGIIKDPTKIRTINDNADNAIIDIRTKISDPAKQEQAITQYLNEAYRCKGEGNNG